MSLGPNYLGKPAPADIGAYTVVAHVVAKGAKEAETLRGLLIAVQKNANSDAEPDCTEYKVTQAVDDPTAFVIYEQYNDQKAFETHVNAEGFKKFADSIPELTSVAHLRFHQRVQT